MSVAAYRAVWERTRARGPAKLVLLAFADFADDAGLAWPSAATVAAMTDRTLRNTRKTIAALVAMGELVPIERRRNRTTKYRLSVCEPHADGVSKTTPREDERGVESDTPTSTAGVSKTTPKGCQKRTSRGVKNDTRTVREPSLEPRSEEASARQAFAAFNRLADELGLVRVQDLTDERRRLVKARLKKWGGLEGWETVLARIRVSPGLCGECASGWKPDIDWILNENNFARIAEGTYDGWNPGANGSGRRQSPQEKLVAAFAAAARGGARGQP